MSWLVKILGTSLTGVMIPAQAESLILPVLGHILCVVIAYLLGSLNFAIIISKIKFRDDIRKHGSGNAGMTNMLRTYGKLAAVMTILGDMLKAFVAALIGIILIGTDGAYLAEYATPNTQQGYRLNSSLDRTPLMKTMKY